jgi:molybdate transport system regulatory protein
MRYVNFDLTIFVILLDLFLAHDDGSMLRQRMSHRPVDLHIRSKVWLVDAAGNAVLGLGRVKMLETIQRLGSINAAAKDLKMSTRAIWGRIKSTEERLGRPLLVRNVGGAAGGGSQLTDFAVELIDLFHFLNQRVKQQSDELFGEACKNKLPR